MKRLKVFSIITVVIMLLAIPHITFAFDDHCPVALDGQHDYTQTKDMAISHPHDGYRACGCGDRIYLSRQYYDECEICRRELCEKGVHYYSYNFVYLDYNECSGYGECFCGKRKEFEYTVNQFHNELYPGIKLRFNNTAYSMIHPHFEYYMWEDMFDYDTSSHDSCCGICKLESDYYWEIEEYEINTLIKKGGTQYNQYNEYYWDEWYEPETEYDDYSDEQDYFYEDDYSYDDEDDELYEWLEIAKEILNE